MLPTRVPALFESIRESAADDSMEGRLLQLARRGNPSAVEELFKRYRSWLRRWARGRMPAWVRDGIDTSDLVHDALCRTFVRLESFRSNRTAALRAYLQRAVENRIHDQCRRARRYSGMNIPDDAAWVCGSGPSGHDQFLEDEGWRDYRDALSRLTARERRLIVGRVQMGYGYRQLALVEGMPTADAARKALGRAMRKLIDIVD